MSSKKGVIVSQSLPPSFGGSLPQSVAELRSVIERAMEAWLSKTESERTRTAYRKDVEQFLEYLGIQPTHIEHMTRVLPEDVTGWRDHLKKYGGRPDADGTPQKGANSTIARKLTAIRSFFSFLQSYGYRGANPAHPHFVTAPSVPDEGQTPGIPPKLVTSLLNAPDTDSPLGVRDKAILAVFAFMAVRVEELQLMNVGNIVQDGEHRIIKIKGKGNKERRGVIPPIAATAVNTWIEMAEISSDRRGPLFRPGMSPRGKGHDGFRRKQMTVRAIQKLVKKYCEQVDIDEAVSVHSLRVTCATEADRAGVPLNEIQRWLGHKDPRTTMRYIRSGQNLDSSPAYVLQTRFSRSSNDDE